METKSDSNFKKKDFFFQEIKSLNEAFKLINQKKRFSKIDWLEPRRYVLLQKIAL